MNGTFEAYKTVAFDIIREQLADLANSAEAREMARGLVPCMEEGELRRSMRDTTQARQMLELAGTPPMPAMEHTAEFVARSVRGELLTPEEMEEIGMFLAAVRRVRSYLDKGISYGIPLSYFGENLRLMPELKEEIEGAIRHGRVDDRASNALRDIRRDLQLLEEKIKDKAEALLKSQKKFMAESFLVTRNGRLCLPVKKEYKSKIPGSVIDRSASGSTVFIEPETIARMQDEIEGLRIEEDCEERRILYTLMDKIAMEEDGFKENLALLAKLDFVFAKGKLSAQMDAREPAINTEGIICLKEARHPLLPEDSNVPLDFKLGGEKRGMVITGQGAPVKAQQQVHLGRMVREGPAQIFLGQLDHRSLHELHRRGHDPLGQQLRHRLHAQPVVGKGDQERPEEPRQRDEPQRGLHHDSQRPLRADHQLHQAVARGILGRFAAQGDHPPVRQHHLQLPDIVAGHAVFHRPHAAGIGHDIAPDGGGLLAGVRRVPFANTSIETDRF